MSLEDYQDTLAKYKIALLALQEINAIPEARMGQTALDIASDALEEIAKIAEEKPLTYICKCGHSRAQHIYEEGACRPGWVCEHKCEKFDNKGSQPAGEK